MMSTSTPTVNPSKRGFDFKVDEIRPSKSDINSLIMDYLVNEGYPMAAKKFAIEANIQPDSDIKSIQERVAIKNAIHAGNIKDAIEKINEVNAKILDDDKALHFALLRLQLVELIRNCLNNPDSDITPALDFATENLAPRAPSNPEFLKDLEETMTLLIFPPDKFAPRLSSLLDPDLRLSVASRVNEAILSTQGQSRNAKIKHLVRMRNWAEVKAREQKITIPDKIDLGLDVEEPRERNFSEDTIMTTSSAIDPLMT